MTPATQQQPEPRPGGVSDSKPRYMTLLEQIDAFLAERPPPPSTDEGPTLRERMTEWLAARTSGTASDGRCCGFCGVLIAGEHHSARYCRECRDPDLRSQVVAMVRAKEAERKEGPCHETK
ncbi:hypothetical protein D3C86_1329860 [compost metagenome]